MPKEKNDNLEFYIQWKYHLQMKAKGRPLQTKEKKIWENSLRADLHYKKY